MNLVCADDWSPSGCTYCLSGIGTFDLRSPAQRGSLTTAAGETLCISPSLTFMFSSPKTLWGE